jgi:hypothetical protein
MIPLQLSWGVATRFRQRFAVSWIPVHPPLRRALLASIAAILGANACSSGRSSASITAACSPDPSINDFGLAVHPVNTRTNARVAATIIAADGDYRETLVPGPGGALGDPPDGYYGVRNRPGLYRLTVAAVGYAVWSRDSIRVQRNASCRLETLFITAPLMPDPVP